MLNSEKNEVGPIQLAVSCIDDEVEFLDLADEWNRLSELTAPDSVFLRHEWFDAAWEWMRQDHQMAILLVKNGPNLVGICPMAIREINYRGSRVRELGFLSIPDSQHCDILVEPGQESNVVASIIKYLFSTTGKWDIVRFCKLHRGSNVMNFLPELASKMHIRFRIDEDGINPGLSLQCSWDEYYARRSRRLKKGNNHVANRLKRAGKETELLHIEAGTGGWEHVSEQLNIIVGISSRSWKHETGLTLNNTGPSKFIKRLSEHAYRNGWLSLWLLKHDDNPVAMEYQLAYKGIISALRADYDPDYEEFSPGTYMNWKILENLFMGDYKYYSMGPGGNSYKLRWAEEIPHHYQITIYSNNIKGRLFGVLDLKIRPLVKRISSMMRNGNRDKN